MDRDLQKASGASSRLDAIMVLVLAMICFPAGAALAKQLFAVFDARGMAALRLAVSALIMASLFRPWRGRLERKEIKLLLAYGIAMGSMNVLFYMAIEKIPLGVAVALEFTGPLSVALLSSRTKLDFLWALVACAGILLLAPLDGVGTLDPWGVFYALAAAFFWGLYIVFGQKAGRTLQGPRAAALGILVASCLVLPIGASHIDVSLLFSFAVLPFVIAVGALSSALPYSLEMFSLQRLPRKTFGIFMSLEPAFAAFLGLVLLNEHLNVRQWIAIFCVIAASAGSAAMSRAPRVKEEMVV